MKAKLYLSTLLLTAFLGLALSTPAKAQNLQAPWLLAPNFNPLVNTSPLELTWEYALGDTSLPPSGETYHVQVSTSSTFANTLLDASGLTTENYNGFPVSASTTYYWRVRLESATDSSSWSSGWFGTTSSITTTITNDTISASSDSYGTITPSGNVVVSSGNSQTFTFTPNTGYKFASLLIDGVSVDSTSSYTFNNVTSNHTIAVSFSVIQDTIFTVAGSNGSISPSDTVAVNYGSSQQFTITPNTGYHTDSVLVDGVIVDSTTTYTFTNVSANHTIAAYFGINTYTITVTPSVTNGTVTSTGIVDSILTVNYGATPTFTITPNAGYEVSSITINGTTNVPVTDSSGQSYQFSGVASNQTITASFIVSDNYYVDASLGTDDSTHGSTKGTGAWKTIQYAIDHVSAGKIINVETGTYNSFSIYKRDGITIKGSSADSVIVNPTSLITTGVAHKYTPNMSTVVFVDSSTNISISGLTIESTTAAPGSGGADAIVFWNSSTGLISGSKVTGTYTINGDQTGQGIAVDAGTGDTTTLSISNTTISGFQKNAIDAVDGNSLSSNPGKITFSVTGCTISGAGATTAIAQNGILVWNNGGGSVMGTVSSTAFSGFDYSAASSPSNYSCAILTFGTAQANIMTVSNCTFSSDIQLYISASSGGNINATNGNTFNGVSPSSASLSQLFSIEDKIDHKLDNASEGVVYVKSNNLYVSNDGTNISIQNGIDAASSGDTLNVNTGTNRENIIVGKSLTLLSSAGADTIRGEVAITHDDVNINGFTITYPTGNSGILVNSVNNVTIENNTIDSIGTSVSIGSAQAIEIYGSSTNISKITVSGNTIKNIGSTSLAYGSGGIGSSAKGIYLGDSQGNGKISYVTIENNKISNVYASTMPWDPTHNGGAGAYGILVNHVSPYLTITGNTISQLEGLWAHGIGLEGNTYNASVQKNSISYLTDHKSPSDAVAVNVDNTNTSAGTLHINNNSFEHVVYGVVNTDTANTVDATENWWGDATGPSISTNPGGLGDSVSFYVNYSPWNTGTSGLYFVNQTSVTGATFSFPVYINVNGNSFNTLQGKFTYDTTKLSFQGATYGLGTLINDEGWTIFFSETSPGTISFAGVGLTPIDSSGLLFNLSFTVLDNNAGSSSLTGNNADFLADGNQIFGNSGSFTGTVTYSHINTTYLRGDVNLDGEVTIEDALLLQNKITGGTLSTLSDLAKQNADADLSSGDPSTTVPDTTQLTANDILYILQYVTAGSWPTPPAANIASAALQFSNASIGNNQLLNLPIAVSNANGVQTLEVTLRYNSKELSYQTFAHLKLNNGDMLDAQKVSDGVVRFVYVSRTPSKGNILPGEIVLRLTNGTPQSGSITTTYSINGGKEQNGPSYNFGVTSVENTVVPKEFSVSQNYPNPFNPSTIINYNLPKSSFVSIKIYDMLGREVKTLVTSEKPAGTYYVQWNGDNNNGEHVASGAYIYRVVAGSNVVVKKMLLLK